MSKKSSEKKRDHRKKEAPTEPLLNPRARRELGAICLILISLLAVMSFFNLAGPFGTYLDAAMSAIFGYTRFAVPFVILGIAAMVAFPERYTVRTPTILGAFLLLMGLGGFLNIVRAPSLEAMLYLDTLSSAGGYLGLVLSYPLLSMVGLWGGAIILGALVLFSSVLTFNVSIHELSVRLMGFRHLSLPWPMGHKSEVEPEAPLFTAKAVMAEAERKNENEAMSHMHDEGGADYVPMAAPAKRKKYRAVSIPVDLLDQKTAEPTAGDINGKMMSISKTLENFGIPVEMGEYSVGPTVTQFTLKPADGIKISRITALSNDLALALAAHPIRIEAPIPGKSLVGIEVPNQSIAVVGLREILESKNFATRGSSLTLCLGKDVAGKPWIADLGKMPHMLVAGATGSGKTVCLNALILSLIYQNSPDDLKLILIDPKRVELPVYNGIPHLLTPAITEVPKIINALKWAITEMDRRFALLAKEGRRDIASYNEVADEKIPYLVIVIDELADLMVASASEVEASIIRLAQLARAVGIHLIVATQRPSVDVITGLIKANITSRIAFSVASAIDSRTILDAPGAEKLVGRGDMLFATSDLSMPKRIQCCYVGDNDIRKVVDFLISQLDEPVAYEEGVTEKKAGASMGFGSGDDDDDLYDEARDIVVKAGKASASYLQRRLKVGYARAARLLDLLEERGIIGPGDGAKPRDILVSPVHDVDGAHFSDEQ